MNTTFLNFYKNPRIRESMVDAAKNREISMRFGEGFGKRPDVLLYPDEVLDLIKQGTTSFHASEELWENPKLISSEMKKKDIEKLRKGWDLILDIDSPFWKISKITAWLIIKGLQDLGVKTISVKFSGNKGFHIGVPFESFPQEFEGELIKNLFPIAPRNIAGFLLDYLTDKYIKVKSDNSIIFGHGLDKQFKISYQKLKELISEKIGELTKKYCSKCKNEIKEMKSESKIEFHCPQCEKTLSSKNEYEKCSKCHILMTKIATQKNLCECGSNDYYIKFNPLSIIEVDTILISSRHLFRMPYSFHEKSGLISIPFNPEKILDFEKKFAKPEIIKKPSIHKFIDREKAIPNEAKDLLKKAMEFGKIKEKGDYDIKQNREFEELKEAIPEVLFPPCIKKILAGVEDGRKRSTFVLINFLKCVGWNPDMIKERIIEWNKANPEPLKEQIILGQLRYHGRNSEKVLPPNCDNKAYFKDMGVCLPDNFCKRIKNPVNYSIMKARNSRKK